MENLEVKLTELSGDIKAFAAKAQEEIKNLGATDAETKEVLEKMRVQMHEMQTQLDAVDQKTQQRHVAAEEQKSIGEQFTTSAEFSAAQANDFVGRKQINATMKSSAFPMSRKAVASVTDTAIGGATSGVLVPQRLPGVYGIAQQALRIRDVMRIVPQTTGNSFDYVYQSTRLSSPSPQVEAAAKAQSTYNWATGSGVIRTIAHFMKVSKQALADIPWLRNTIDGELTYGLKVKEEAEILSGDGTGVHLNGIITQATAFSTAYLVAAAGWQRLDQLRFAKLQARLAGLATYAPSAFVLHPTDLAKLELTKDSYGHYIIGDPKTGVNVDYVWKLPVVESDSITAGTFLVGAFDSAASLIDRQAVSIDISFEDGSNFQENMATILCEERVGLAVNVASAFISGTFSTSPATQN